MVPTYIRVMQQEGKAEAQALLSRVMVLGVVLLCGVYSYLLRSRRAILPVPVLARGFSHSQASAYPRSILLFCCH